MSETAEAHGHDSAPGDEVLDGSGVAHGVAGYLVGLVMALGLTAASFYLADSGLIWKPGVPAALIALAIAQMGVHLVFFLHLTTGPESTNNVLALAFGVLIVLLLLGGTLFIMSNLTQSMPPLGQVMHAEITVPACLGPGRRRPAPRRRQPAGAGLATIWTRTTDAWPRRPTGPCRSKTTP